MKTLLASTVLCFAFAFGLEAQTTAAAPAAPELTNLLNDFLAGASRNDVAMHDRFWADDLIYTSAKGRRKGKADIMRELREETAPTQGEAQPVYTADEIRIQQYGDSAIVAFRLVATTETEGRKEIAHYLNTGTFLKRAGNWQAVGWQATAVPLAEEQTK